MTETQLDKIKKIAHALDSELEYCDITHLNNDGKAGDVSVLIHAAGTPISESNPMGSFRVTSDGKCYNHPRPTSSSE
jgi:hypothetical protein